VDEYIYELMNKRWGAGRVSNISGIGGPVSSAQSRAMEFRRKGEMVSLSLS